MPEQAPAGGDVPVIVEKADYSNTRPRPQQCPDQTPVRQTSGCQQRQGQQKTQHNRHTATTRSGYAVRAAGIGDIHETARQGIAAQATRQSERKTGHDR
ncbi:hypothetical protein D3C78_852410 [compost metagenome]